jgi:tripartite-type tricarboxylate transporter receptor subunit TctC
MSFVALIAAGSDGATSQGYPNKPIRIVTGAPGGGSDFASRLIAQALTESFGQQVVVDNRGNVAGEIVSKALPDGYTLLLDGASFWIGPLLQETSYDPLRDFSPVSAATLSPGILVVHPSVPANSVKELIALAKARPGEINYGSGGAGASTHLAPELFNVMAGVNITRINYKGAGPAINGLIGGEVQMMIPPAGSVSTHVKAGRLRALGITSAQPSALLPGLPTVAASGVPGYEAVSMTGMFAPAKTPAAIINRVSEETVRVLNRADVKERFLNSGVEAVGNTPQQFAAAVKSEMVKWGKVIKDAGVREK